MRKTLRIVGIAVGGVLLLGIVYLGLLLFPGISFAHHVVYDRFTVHSNAAYGDEIKSILGDVQAIVERSEIFDPSLNHDVYFGADDKYFTALHKPLGITYNLSWPPYVSQIITLRVPDYANNALRHPAFSGSTNLRQTLAHEVTHSFLRARLGLLGVARSPLWKQEGYAEFVAAYTTLANPSYDIRNSVQRIVANDLAWMKNASGGFTEMQRGCAWRASMRNEDGYFSPTCYYIARVLWEYLVNVKGLTFDAVMSPDITDVDTLAELIKVYASPSRATITESL